MWPPSSSSQALSACRSARKPTTSSSAGAVGDPEVVAVHPVVGQLVRRVGVAASSVATNAAQPASVEVERRRRRQSTAPSRAWVLGAELGIAAAQLACRRTSGRASAVMRPSHQARTAAATGFPRPRTGTCSRVRRWPGYVQGRPAPEEVDRQRSALRAVHPGRARAGRRDDPHRGRRRRDPRGAGRDRGDHRPAARASQLDGPYGVRFSADGRGRAWGNAVVGLRNADRAAAGRSSSDEPTARAGPTSTSARPTRVRPGWSTAASPALILDQMLGEAAGAGGKPGMTGTLTLRYRQRHPARRPARRGLDRPRRGHQDLGQGRHPSDADGVTVEAEGVFILPRWAREAIARAPRRRRRATSSSALGRSQSGSTPVGRRARRRR